jgi:trehalose-6-phosphate synthase
LVLFVLAVRRIPTTQECLSCRAAKGAPQEARDRFAGAAHECKAALLGNPYDPDSVAAAIGSALSMALAERRERHDALFQVLSHNDIQHWADRFLAALEREPTALSHLEQMPFIAT